VKVSELLQQRRQNWQELEHLCEQISAHGTRRLAWLRRRRPAESPPGTTPDPKQGSPHATPAGASRPLDAAAVSRMASLYRAACADLALADAYQLPPNTVDYLHRLVGRAHNQLYRSRNFNLASWSQLLFHDAPQRIFSDRCIQVAFCTFWGVFILSALMAYSKSIWPGYAESVMGHEMIDLLEANFKEPMSGRDAATNYVMAGYYIKHNTGIGLQCFAFGLAVVPGIFVCIFNAGVLGASFGYMARPDVAEGVNFFHFVTAHGPFELTAIVLAAGCGLRLGFSWIFTEGYSRTASLRRTGEYCMPMIGAARPFVNNPR
jgi:uncharacterized membrane protein SpoIIM required for sporulation